MGEKEQLKKKVHPRPRKRPPQPPPSPPPFGNGRPLPPIKNRDPTADFDFDDRDSEEESKSDHEDEDEQKIDVKTTPDGQRLKPGAPSFRGLQRLNTEHRFKITRQMSALQKLDLDGDGELEPDEIIKAY